MSRSRRGARGFGCRGGLWWFGVGLGCGFGLAADEEQVLVLAEAFFPHLLRRVAFGTMTLFPGHSAFRGVIEITGSLGTIEWSQTHVRGYDGSTVGILFQNFVSPV